MTGRQEKREILHVSSRLFCFSQTSGENIYILKNKIVEERKKNKKITGTIFFFFLRLFRSSEFKFVGGTD